MTSAASSSLRVPYDLRQAKQVERRMIVDLLQRLMQGGFRIREYQYTGLGSIYFVDFILFHRILGINRLWSAEYDTGITKRVEFNRPFSHITVFMEPIGDVIPKLDRDLKHILWLDYDYGISKSIVADAALAAYSLSPGSMLLITVDVEPPTPIALPAESLEHYRDEAGGFFDLEWKEEYFTPSQLGPSASRILFNAIANGAAGRPSTRFLPLLNLTYRDGHRMITVGGILAGPKEQTALMGCDLQSATYLRLNAGDPPFEIKVPSMTRRERLYLDRNMPCVRGWLPAEFEMNQDEVDNYAKIYRYLPTFAELYP